MSITLNRVFRGAACLLPLVMALLLGTSTTAQARTIRGTFKYAPEQEELQELDRAIINATKPLPDLLGKGKREARRELRMLEKPYNRMILNCSDERVEVTFDDNAPVRSRADNDPVLWTRRIDTGKVKNGKPVIAERTFRVRSRWEGETLVQEFAEDRGKGVRKYSLSPDGKTLNVAVTISGGALGFNLAPKTFKLTYSRQE